MGSENGNEKGKDAFGTIMLSGGFIVLLILFTLTYLDSTFIVDNWYLDRFIIIGLSLSAVFAVAFFAKKAM